MVYTAFFHTFSSASFSPIFSPNNVNTTLAVRITNTGGEPRAFISVICPLFIPATAALALSKAGKASDKAVSASSLILLASAAAILVYSSSMLAEFYSTSAIADSLPTISIKASVSCFLYPTTIILAFNSVYNPSTFS
jgi:hypothetical protein